MRLQRVWLLVLLAPLQAIAQPATYSAPEMRARVTNQATGEGIADTAILAQWVLHTQSIGGGASGYMDSLHEFEATTDANGWFVIPAWGPKIRPPGSELDVFTPKLKILRAGFYPVVLANQRVAKPTDVIVVSEWNGKTIELSPFDGDWLRYARGLTWMWKGYGLFECESTCPQMVRAVYAEWNRIRKDIPKEVTRRVLPPPNLQAPTQREDVILKQNRDARRVQ